MGNVAIGRDGKLYMIELDEDCHIMSAHELTDEEIAQLPEKERCKVELAKQQLAMMELVAAKEEADMAFKLCNEYLCNEYYCYVFESIRQGWGYKPKLNPAARKPHRAKPYWHRTRSFCVRKGYH